VVLYLYWTHRYYGSLLPYSFYKANSHFDINQVKLGLEYFAVFLKVNLNYLALGLNLMIFFYLIKGRINKNLIFISLAVFSYYIYIIMQGGVGMMFTFRFYTPLLPVFYVVAVKSFSLINFSERIEKVAIESLVVVIVCVNFITFHHAYYKDMNFTNEKGHDHAREEVNTNILGQILTHERWKETAIRFSDIIPKNARVCCWSAGIFPFFIDASFYDNLLIGFSPLEDCQYEIGPCNSFEEVSDKPYIKYPNRPPSTKCMYYPWHTSFYLKVNH